MKVGIILADGPKQKDESFADWIRNQVSKRLEFPVEMLDLRDSPPSSKAMEDGLDAFVVMTPEQSYRFWVLEERSRLCLIPFSVSIVEEQVNVLKSNLVN